MSMAMVETSAPVPFTPERTLLIVEDDKAFLQRLARAMEGRGFEVRTAETVADGLLQVEKMAPSYAVVDMRLADGNGLDVISALKQRRPDARALVLTGYGNIATAVNAVKIGAVDYLAKPADADDIIAALMANRRQEGRAARAPDVGVDRVRWEHIQRIYELCSRNVSETARRLNMHRRTLQRILAKRAPRWTVPRVRRLPHAHCLLSSSPLRCVDRDGIGARARTQRTNRSNGQAAREGELTLYSALTTEDNAALIGGFEKQYGIKVRLWRASSETLLRRIVSEAGARRFDVDAVLSSGSGLEPLHRERLLLPIQSPLMAGLIPGALLPHREWTLMFVNPIVQAYNTRLIKPDDPAAQLRDLLQPEWKGQARRRGRGLRLVRHRDRRAWRDRWPATVPQHRRHATLARCGQPRALTNMVVAGEGTAGADGLQLSIMVKRLEKKLPIDWFVLGDRARPTGVAVAKAAPHPAAAALFFDFMIGDAQPILASRSLVSVSKTIETPFTKMPLKIMNSRLMLDEADRWRALYKRARCSVCRTDGGDHDRAGSRYCCSRTHVVRWRRAGRRNRCASSSR